MSCSNISIIKRVQPGAARTIPTISHPHLPCGNYHAAGCPAAFTTIYHLAIYHLDGAIDVPTGASRHRREMLDTPETCALPVYAQPFSDLQSK